MRLPRTRFDVQRFVEDLSYVNPYEQPAGMKQSGKGAVVLTPAPLRVW